MRSGPYRSGTSDRQSFDFEAEAKPLRAEWKAVNGSLLGSRRQRIEVLVRTRHFLIEARRHRAAFNQAAAPHRIIQGLLETRVLRFVHGVDTTTSRTPVKRLADALAWLAD